MENLNIGERKRQSSFDVLKCLAIILVIMIHTIDSGVHTYIMPFTRMGVPIFFVITGYYFQTMVRHNRLYHQIKKVFWMAVFSSLFYFLIFGMYHNGLSQKGLLHFILFNAPFFSSDHLWYLWAILYVLIILSITEKLNISNSLYYLLPILLVGNYILRCHRIVDRNFLFAGLLYVLLGMLIRKKQNWLRQLSIKNCTFCLVFFLSCILLIMELKTYEYLNMPIVCEYYMMTFPMAVIIFVWALRNPNFGNNSIVATIGRDYSAYIYIFHMFFISIVKNFVPKAILLIPLVFVLSILFSIIIMKITKFYKVVIKKI